MNRCSSFVNNAGDVHPFDLEMRVAFENVKDTYSSQGKRCLLLARKVIRQDELQHQAGTSQFEDEINVQAKSDLTLVGLVAIVDPLRPEIREVVSTLRGAGIKVFMVRGYSGAHMICPR